jgi:hypothetical protein
MVISNKHGRRGVVVSVSVQQEAIEQDVRRVLDSNVVVAYDVVTPNASNIVSWIPGVDDAVHSPYGMYEEEEEEEEEEKNVDCLHVPMKQQKLFVRLPNEDWPKPRLAFAWAKNAEQAEELIFDAIDLCPQVACELSKTIVEVERKKGVQLLSRNDGDFILPQ